MASLVANPRLRLSPFCTWFTHNFLHCRSSVLFLLHHVRVLVLCKDCICNLRSCTKLYMTKLEFYHMTLIILSSIVLNITTFCHRYKNRCSIQAEVALYLTILSWGEKKEGSQVRRYTNKLQFCRLRPPLLASISDHMRRTSSGVPWAVTDIRWFIQDKVELFLAL